MKREGGRSNRRSKGVKGRRGKRKGGIEKEEATVGMKGRRYVGCGRSGGRRRIGK